MPEPALKSLESCGEAGGFSPLDLHFARFIARVSGTEAPELMLAAALVSRRTGTGHICCDLAEIAGKQLAQTALVCPQLDSWRQVLAASPAVAAGDGGSPCPLVLDAQGRLYLYRYWLYEKELAEFLLQKSMAVEPCDREKLRMLLDRLFAPEAGLDNYQRLAAYTAAVRRLTVICGGPGTGKTTTVAKILALLAGLAKQPLRIALAAPTGKAADRMRQAIGRAVQTINCEAGIKEAIPREAFTLHRLLGLTPDEARARYHEKNQLPFDVVIVDEASMIDLPVMAKLARALPGHARLVLLGDKDQLASVESGAVLGDLCAGGRVEAFSPDHIRAYESLTGGHPGLAAAGQAPPLADCIVELSRNYRFASDSGIGALALAVKTGDSAEALSILQSHRSDILWQQGPGAPELHETMRYYGPACRSADPGTALDLLAGFRILCAVREGRRGVTGLNCAVESSLEAAHRIRRSGLWYHGRPVMITRNDYGLRLFNGDIGIISQGGDGALRACFAGPDGSARSFAAARLPEHETAWALTVHKSQGSEFDKVMIVLPDTDMPVVSRELLYTAITRARTAITLCATAEILAAAVQRGTRRASGLRDRLKQAANPGQL